MKTLTLRRRVTPMKAVLLGTEIPKSDGAAAKYLMKRYLPILERTKPDRVRVEIEREVERLQEEQAAGKETIAAALTMICYVKGGKRGYQLLKKWCEDKNPNISAAAFLAVLHHTTGAVSRHAQSQLGSLSKPSIPHFETALHLCSGRGLHKAITIHKRMQQHGYQLSRSGCYAFIRCCKDRKEVDQALTILGLPQTLTADTDPQILLSVAQSVSYKEALHCYDLFMSRTNSRLDIVAESPLEKLIEKHSLQLYSSRPDYDVHIRWRSALLISFFREFPREWDELLRHYEELVSCVKEVCDNSGGDAKVTRSVGYLRGSPESQYNRCRIAVLTSGLTKLNDLLTLGDNQQLIKSIVHHCEQVFRLGMHDSRCWVLLFRIYKAAGMRKRSLILGRYRASRGRPSFEVITAYLKATSGVTPKSKPQPPQPQRKQRVPTMEWTASLTPPGVVNSPLLPWKPGERPSFVPKIAKDALRDRRNWDIQLRKLGLVDNHRGSRAAKR
eukprot:TRINITY_DN34259_c0_g1_i1.p1 TRINITY_DN34259_c0_g1~~TRINITY_DN34259_c0_g1_i1.p1  ORF type:complete len:500 (+),score=60.55 TRINITY_DN34259_c0_g1_i1:115-1614(+)